MPAEVRVRTLNVLALAALKDDVILLLHQDRRDHILMNCAFDIDRHGFDEQVALATLVCNMFENLSSSEWLLYISEWQYNGQQTSNIRVTTKVAVHSLLADAPELQDRGAAIIHNLACKEVKTVVCISLVTLFIPLHPCHPTLHLFYSTISRCRKFALSVIRFFLLLVLFAENVQKLSDPSDSTRRQSVEGRPVNVVANFCFRSLKHHQIVFLNI